MRELPQIVTEQIAEYRNYRMIWQAIFWTLIGGSIVCSTLVASLQEVWKDKRTRLVIISALAAICTGLIAGLKPREHAIALKRAEGILKVAAATYQIDSKVPESVLSDAVKASRDEIEKAER